MKNILFIHQSAELYGSDKTLLLLLKNLDKTLYHPVVVLPNEGPLIQELEKENIKVVIAPVLKLYRKIFSPKNLFHFLLDIKKGISILDNLNKQYHFDLIYSNTLAVLLGMLFAKKRKIKHLWHVHEIIVHPKIIASTFPKLLNKYADLIVCNSLATKKNLVDRKKELANKTTVIYNGINETISEMSLAKKEDFGFTNKDIIITLVGRISRLKGHKWLLTTLVKHFSSNTNIKVVFVGSPVPGQEYYASEIDQFITENQLQKTVKILPFTKNLSPIWDITDIALMPSTEAESFGLVAAEAMLAKKPVIASNHGGLTEIVLHNQTGLLVEPNNVEALSEALKKLITNPQLRKEFGENGYQRAIKEFSIEKYVQNFEVVFSKLIP
ncbi:glycosyltransferase family 4 protein [Flavobacterium sp.]|jgi:glycosyltransferase involved in cell wall biosynthesis|uniref:glycosyltransferase family 4 protein n=1 Tax=Flavobacterium sp. TaxID=239 RepID=UPI0037BE9DAF